MSQNLVELIRRHHAVDAPTALEVLKEAVEDHGEVTDDDRRRAAELSGVPEAAVYGISTFYDDLLVRRGRRHVRVCTGTACFAATGDEHVREIERTLGLKLGERSDDPLSMYLADIYTVTGSLAGITGISVPCGATPDGLPIGMQIYAPAFSEDRLLQAAHAFEQAHNAAQMN